MGARTAAFLDRVIIVDANVWIDHLRGEVIPRLDDLVLADEVGMHPHVLGEVSLGGVRDRERVIARLSGLPVPNVAREGHVHYMIDEHKLWGTGISYTDAHLIASARVTPDGYLWTRDKRLHAQAARLGVAYEA